MTGKTDDFLYLMHRFRKLNPFSLLPMPRHDYMVLQTICCLSKGGDTKLTVSAVAKEMNVVSPAVSRTLKNLEQQGLAERMVCPSDRRNTYVRLTEKGKSALEECGSILEKFHSGVLESIPSADMKQLTELLGRVYAACEEQLEQMKKGDNTENG